MKRHRRSKPRLKKAKRKDQEAAWELRFEQLKAYRRKHGHCQVPSCSKKYLSLGHCVNYQRVLHRPTVAEHGGVIQDPQVRRKVQEFLDVCD